MQSSVAGLRGELWGEGRGAKGSGQIQECSCNRVAVQCLGLRSMNSSLPQGYEYFVAILVTVMWPSFHPCGGYAGYASCACRMPALYWWKRCQNALLPVSCPQQLEQDVACIRAESSASASSVEASAMAANSVAMKLRNHMQ
eukprot:scaffold65185_cov16-Tisochrysis_lutea.AAC.1